MSLDLAQSMFPPEYILVMRLWQEFCRNDAVSFSVRRIWRCMLLIGPSTFQSFGQFNHLVNVMVFAIFLHCKHTVFLL